MWKGYEDEQCALVYADDPVTEAWVALGFALRAAQDCQPLTAKQQYLLKQLNILGDPELNLDACQSKPIYTIIVIGNQFMFGSNGLRQKTDGCHRHIHQLDEYHLCYTACTQVAHAEEMLFIKYVAKFFPEHLQTICSGTLLDESGNIIEFGQFDFEAAMNSEIKFPPGTQMALWGANGCCNRCAALMQQAGVGTVRICPPTLEDNYRRRGEIHSE